jgi:hypothetical protein
MDGRLRGLSFVVLVSVAAGCGGSPLDPGGGQGPGGSAAGAMGSGGSAGGAMGSGGSAAGGAGGNTVVSVAPGFTAAAAAMLCSEPFGARLNVSSIADMRYRLSRDWVLCSDPSVTPFHVPEAGISIYENDRYAFLAWSAQGQLVELRGAENEGSLQYLDLGPVNGQEDIQVSFVSDAGLTIIASPPILSVDPRFLYINNEGVEIYTYVQTPELP